MDRTRSGLLAARSTFGAPPSITAPRTGRSDPTASRTTRRSATRVSRSGSETFLLDKPVPLRSWRISRAQDAIPLNRGADGAFPYHVDVADEVELPSHIHGTFADDLVADVDAVWCLRIQGLGNRARSVVLVSEPGKGRPPDQVPSE